MQEVSTLAISDISIAAMMAMTHCLSRTYDLENTGGDRATAKW